MRPLLFAAALVFVTVSGAKAQDQATVVAACGAAHLTAGTQAFRQVDTNGVTCSAGGGSAVVSSVWSAADAAANGMTLSNGGLTVVATQTSVWGTVRGSVSKASGKVYVEFYASSTVADSDVLVGGVASSGFISTNYLSSSNYSAFAYHTPALGAAGSSGFTANYTSTLPDTVQFDVFGLAIDFTAGSIWVSKNNVWSNSSNPATGALPVLSFVPATVGALFPAISFFRPDGGTWTLQPTAASQKYAAPAGFTPWDGASGHSAQAVAYLARTVGGNEGGNGTNIANLIDGLVTDGVWSNMDALYVLAQQNETDAKLNLIGTSYGLPTNAATFTAYQGYFVGGGTINTGFNIATAPSPHITQNSGHVMVWGYNAFNTGTASAEISSGNSLGDTSIIGNDGTGTFYGYIAVGASPNNYSVVAPSGLLGVDRTSSSHTDYYINGANVHSNSNVSQVPDNANLIIGPTGTTMSAICFGASLGSAGNLALYNRLRTYLTSVGVP